jgi:hypothetical protein
MSSDPMVWTRTGKITMRCEPYLIMRFSTGYHALHGAQCARTTLGVYPTADDAKAACEAHRLATGEKNPEAPDTVPG